MAAPPNACVKRSSAARSSRRSATRSVTSRMTAVKERRPPSSVGAERELDRELLAVAAHALELDRAARARAVAGGGVAGQARRGARRGSAPASGPRASCPSTSPGRPAEHRLGAVGEEDDAAVLVGGDDRVARRVHDRPQAGVVVGGLGPSLLEAGDQGAQPAGDVGAALRRRARRRTGPRRSLRGAAEGVGPAAAAGVGTGLDIARLGTTRSGRPWAGRPPDRSPDIGTRPSVLKSRAGDYRALPMPRLALRRRLPARRLRRRGRDRRAPARRPRARRARRRRRADRARRAAARGRLAGAAARLLRRRRTCSPTRSGRGARSRSSPPWRARRAWSLLDREVPVVRPFPRASGLHDAALTSAVVDALDDVVFATDPQGRLTYLNPAWTRAHRAPRRGLAGHAARRARRGTGAGGRRGALPDRLRRRPLGRRPRLAAAGRRALRHPRRRHRAPPRGLARGRGRGALPRRVRPRGDRHGDRRHPTAGRCASTTRCARWPAAARRTCSSSPSPTSRTRTTSPRSSSTGSG